jgi:hypothetical protein
MKKKAIGSGMDLSKISRAELLIASPVPSPPSIVTKIPLVEK